MSSATTPPRTIAEAAGMIGVDSRSLTTWLQKGCPGKHGGVYDVKAILDWRDRNIRIKTSDNRQQPDQPTAGPSLNESRAREAAARADLAAMKAQKLRGELISLHEATMYNGLAVQLVRKYLTDLPLLICARLSFSCPEDMNKCRGLVEKMVDDSLSALHGAYGQIIYLAENGGAGKFSDDAKSAVISKAEAEADDMIERAAALSVVPTYGEAAE